MRILLVNVHSAKNLGDEAIMQATLDGIYETWADAFVTVAANDPQSWLFLKDVNPHIDVLPSICSWIGDCRLGKFREHAWRMPLVFLALWTTAYLYRIFRIRILFGSSQQQALLSAFFDCDLVLSCGGGNFYAHNKVSPAFLWNLVVLAFPNLLGKTVILLPQSIGPVEGALQRRLAAHVLNRCCIIMTREEISAGFVKNILHISRPVLVQPDLTFALHPTQVIKQPIEAGKTPGGLAIGVTILDRGAQNKQFKRQEQYEQSLSSLLMALSHENSAVIHIFVQCTGPSADQDDRMISDRLFQFLLQNDCRVFLHNEYSNAEQLRVDFAKMDLIIGTRLHTGILALSCYVPILLIGYQPKALGMMEQFGLGKYLIDIKDIDSMRITDLAHQILSRREELTSEIKERYMEMNKKAQNWKSCFRSPT